MGIPKKAAKRTAQYKAYDAATNARPYVQRLIEDEGLRDDLREAFDAAKNAVDRAAGKSSPFEVVDDSKLHDELKTAAESLRSASEALREPEKKSGGGGGFFKLVLVAVVAAVLALVLSEGLRKAVLDALFGAEEEFEYSSTTSPPPAPASSDGS
ncbi:MAG: hypothetical protein ACR2K6_01010 [Solirubrobacterales bacterium]